MDVKEAKLFWKDLPSFDKLSFEESAALTEMIDNLFADNERLTGEVEVLTRSMERHSDASFKPDWAGYRQHQQERDALTEKLAAAVLEHAALQEKLETSECLHGELQEYHNAAMKELYRILGVDGSDGEIRFKWAALAACSLVRERNDLLEKLQVANAAAGEREKALVSVTVERDQLIARSQEIDAELHKLESYTAITVAGQVAELVAEHQLLGTAKAALEGQVEELESELSFCRAREVHSDEGKLHYFKLYQQANQRAEALQHEHDFLVREMKDATLTLGRVEPDETWEINTLHSATRYAAARIKSLQDELAMSYANIETIKTTAAEKTMRALKAFMAQALKALQEDAANAYEGSHYRLGAYCEMQATKLEEALAGLNDAPADGRVEAVAPSEPSEACQVRVASSVPAQVAWDQAAAAIIEAAANAGFEAIASYRCAFFKDAQGDGLELSDVIANALGDPDIGRALEELRGLADHVYCSVKSAAEAKR